MENKAAILTFHCVENYGAVLQTFGLQQYLKNYFSEVVVIDYRPAHLTSEYELINTYSFFSVIASLWALPTFKRKKNKFKRFIKRNIKVSPKKYFTAEGLEAVRMDVLFLGSDQIWNPQITSGVDPVYFGNLNWKCRPRIVSYAASIGKNNLSKKEEQEFRKLLANVDSISVREYEAKNIISVLTDNTIAVVADPTILAGKGCFERFVCEPSGQKYVLLYSLNGYKETSAMAVKISKYLGIDLIEISGRRKSFLGSGHRTIYSADPKDFVSLIGNAEYVITDSFHGTVFSLMFHKRFVTIPHKTRNGRIYGLLDSCDMLDRLTFGFDRKLMTQEIDWKNVDNCLNGLKEKSDCFIREAIGFNDGVI